MGKRTFDVSEHVFREMWDYFMRCGAQRLKANAVYKGGPGLNTERLWSVTIEGPDVPDGDKAPLLKIDTKPGSCSICCEWPA